MKRIQMVVVAVLLAVALSTSMGARSSCASVRDQRMDEWAQDFAVCSVVFGTTACHWAMDGSAQDIQTDYDWCVFFYGT